MMGGTEEVEWEMRDGGGADGGAPPPSRRAEERSSTMQRLLTQHSLGDLSGGDVGGR
jgi:hypothetical protein